MDQSLVAGGNRKGSGVGKLRLRGGGERPRRLGVRGQPGACRGHPPRRVCAPRGGCVGGGGALVDKGAHVCRTDQIPVEDQPTACCIVDHG